MDRKGFKNPWLEYFGPLLLGSGLVLYLGYFLQQFLQERFSFLFNAVLLNP